MLEIISEKLKNKRARDKRNHIYHKEEHNERDREWYAENKDKRRISKQAWQKANKEKLNAIARERYKTHKEEYYDKTRKRRAIQKAVVGSHFTQKQFRDLCNFYGNKCLCCGRSGVKLSADHVIPLGPPYSDEISNIQPLCLTCNQKKGTKTIDYRNQS